MLFMLWPWRLGANDKLIKKLINIVNKVYTKSDELIM